MIQQQFYSPKRAVSSQQSAVSSQQSAVSSQQSAVSSLVFCSLLVLFIVMLIQPVHPQAQGNYQTLGEYPIPVSESVEETGPGTMVFLSYPKYYRDAEEKLALVETDLVKSTDPEWDYEVSKGIWQLKVKTDGTFQAQHEGDVFTYRFQNLGIGQGSQFRSVDLGEPDFSKFEVIGDTIRWSEVLPDIDLTVRYIHDILKVDVIVKKEFMNDLRAEVKSGGLSGDNNLTARFDIPSVFITSQAKQGDQTRDIYAEAIALNNEPLTFERDGKVLHKLRPVESYVLDENGEPMYWDSSNEPIQIRSSQRWQLQRGGGGFAEMSANLGDLANAPEGDVVIDPSTVFSPSSQDTMIKYNSSNVYGNSSIVTCRNLSTQSDSDHPLFGFDVSALTNPNTVLYPVELFVRTGTVTINPNIRARAFKVTKDWNESANWFSTGCCGSWGTNWYNSSSSSPEVILPNTSNQWIVFDVDSPFLSHYFAGSPNDVKTKGFMLDLLDQTSGYLNLIMKEHSTVGWRPKLRIKFNAPKHGGDVGIGLDDILTTGQRLQDGKEDQLQILRYFAGGESLDRNKNYVSNAHSRNMQVMLVFSPWEAPVYNPIEYASFIDDRLTQIEANTPGVLGKTILTIQLGNEIDNFNGHNGGGNDAYNAGWEYAPFYVATHDLIKQKWPFLEIMAGSLENSNSLGFVKGDNPKIASPISVPSQYRKADNGKAAVAFFNGFIQNTIVLSGGTKDKLPDLLSVHGYPAAFPPEIIQDEVPTNGTKDWTNRLRLLEDITFFYNYFPRYAVTEYGFSPKLGKAHAPIDVANVKTQAIYFMRRTLMDTSLRGLNFGIQAMAWDYTTYWQHSFNPDGGGDPPGEQGNTGWYSAWTQQESERRIIVDVARKIWKQPASGGTDPGLNGAITWAAVPFSEVRNIQPSYDETIRCGWLNLAGQKWGAVWRFENTLESQQQQFPPIDLETYYIPPSSESRTFTVQGENPGTAHLYQFQNYSFTDPIGFGTAQWVSLGTVNPTIIGSNAVYTIPAVTENPIFIKF